MRSLNRREIKRYFEKNVESAEGVPPEAFAMAIIKIACVFVVGIVILNGVVVGTNLSANSTFYGLMQSVQGNITISYALASLMLLVLGASAVMYFLGFM